MTSFNYKNLNLRNKLFLFFIPLTVLLVTILVCTSLTSSKKVLKDSSTRYLENIANMKVDKLQDFYTKIYNDILFLQKNTIIENNGNNLSNSNSDTLSDKMKIFLSSFTNSYSYHSIKLLNIEGKELYSSSKTDFLKIEELEKNAFNQGKRTIFFSEVFKQEQESLMIISAPLFSNKKLMGVVMARVNLVPIYEFVKDRSGLGETGETFLIKKEATGASLLTPLRNNVAPVSHKEFIESHISSTPSTNIFDDYMGKKSIVINRFIPSFNWILITKMDTNEAFSAIYRTQQNILSVSLIVIIIALILLFSFTNYITAPIIKLKNSITVLSQGNDLKEPLIIERADEIGSMVKATNHLSMIQKNITEFAQNIGSGNFDIQSNIDNIKGDLGASLTNMSANLKDIAKADEKRNWTTIGLAKFAEILRASDDEIENLTDIIISNLIKYLQANQGSIFILEDDGDQSFLELNATYAWDRKKYKEKRILIGEGLVGRCWQEVEKIYLTDIPENYINITSGLGKANPKSLLIIPMKIEEQVFGIIEIASFNEIQPYQIEFVEKLAESIASTISNAKTNTRTAFLLEESKEMTEELRAQEEEMRQNMEEMQATQEEMERTQNELRSKELFLNSLVNNTSDSIIAIDNDYKVVVANDTIRERYKKAQHEVLEVGFNVLELLGDVREEWKGYYDKALNGEKLHFIIESFVNKKPSYREYFIHPMKNSSDKIVGCSIFSREVLDHIDKNKILIK